MAKIKDIQDFPNNVNNDPVKKVAMIIGLVLIVFVIYYVWKATKTAATAAGDVAGSLIIEQTTGISIQRQLVCKQIATDCRNAMTVLVFTNYVMSVDESAIISALNRVVSNTEANFVCQVFRENNGMSLKNVIDNSFSQSEKIQITNYNSLT